MSYTAGRYQDWYAEKVLEQLNSGIQAHDIAVDIRLSTIKPLLARWISDMYKHLKESKGLSRLRKSHISEPVHEASSLVQLCDNPFQEIYLTVNAV